jgi:hypothetical protein
MHTRRRPTAIVCVRTFFMSVTCGASEFSSLGSERASATKYRSTGVYVFVFVCVCVRVCVCVCVCVCM